MIANYKSLGFHSVWNTSSAVIDLTEAAKVLFSITSYPTRYLVQCIVPIQAVTIGIANMIRPCLELHVEYF